MDLSKILSRLLFKADSPGYLDRYDEKYDNLNELFIQPLDIETITDQPILLLLDEKPHSLISIAYALRFAKDLGCKIYVISEETHGNIMKEEAEEVGVEIEFLLQQDEYTLEEIEEQVDLITIGFIVTNIRHRLVHPLLEISPIPLFITKIE